MGISFNRHRFKSGDAIRAAPPIRTLPPIRTPPPIKTLPYFGTVISVLKSQSFIDCSGLVGQTGFKTKMKMNDLLPSYGMIDSSSRKIRIDMIALWL
jgi:hypothetical protein